MARLSKINGGNKTASVVINGEQLNFTFNRAKYTPEYEQSFQAKLRGDTPGRALAVMMKDILIAWDVEDDSKDPIGWEDGQKTIPIQWPTLDLTVDNIFKSCSVDTIRAMVEEMSKVQTVKPTNSSPSNDTFEAMVDEG